MSVRVGAKRLVIRRIDDFDQSFLGHGDGPFLL